MLIIFLIPILLGVLVLVGLIFALPARIPRIQSRAIGDKTFRKRLMIGFGIVGFLAAYFGLTWSYAGTQTSQFQSWFAISSSLEFISKSEIQREIWMRIIFLSGGSDACFNPKPEFCRIVTTALSEQSIAGFRWVVIAFPLMLFAAISGFSSAFFTWRFTNYDGKSKRDKSTKAKV